MTRKRSASRLMVPAVQSGPPGQRRALLVSMPDSTCVGLSAPVGPRIGSPVFDSENALNVVPIRPMPPVASVTPEVPNVLNQETTSGVYGRRNESIGRSLRGAQTDSPNAP